MQGLACVLKTEAAIFRSEYLTLRGLFESYLTAMNNFFQPCVYVASRRCTLYRLQPLTESMMRPNLSCMLCASFAATVFSIIPQRQVGPVGTERSILKNIDVALDCSSGTYACQLWQFASNITL